MPESDSIETVDAEPVLALDMSLAGLGAGLPAHLLAELVELIADAEHYAAAQALNTTRAYASDWRQFQGWCERYRLQSLPAPAAVIALYLTSLAKRGLAVSTIRRRAAAIGRRTAKPATCRRPPTRAYSPSWRASPACTVAPRTRRPRCCATRCSS